MVGIKTLVKHLKVQPRSIFKPRVCHPMLDNNDPVDEQQLLEIREEIRQLEVSYRILTGHPWSSAADRLHSTKLPTSKARKLDAQIRALHTILSPIRRIPDEVLQEILFFSAICNTCTDKRMGLQLIHVPLSYIKQLALVCRRWRRAILDAHFLWQHMRLWILLDEADAPKEHDRQMENIRKLFKNTGSLPVWFNMNYLGSRGSQVPGAEHVWKLLLENAAPIDSADPASAS